MKLHALSIGEAVPRENFDAVIQSAFESAVNLRLTEADRLITMHISDVYELPQGIRILTSTFSLQTLTPGLHAAARGGILRFDSSSLTVDMRNAPRWKCSIPELGLDMRSSVARQAWSTVWSLLNREQKHKNTDLHADDLLRLHTGSPLSQRISKPVIGLVTATHGFDVQGALHAARQLLGLGPGLTPSGDDILIGFLAGLWSMVGQNERRLTFIHSFGRKLTQLTQVTGEISRTYIHHATHGQFSSSLTYLVEAIASGEGVEEATQAALCVGHSSGMDVVTGLLIGMCVWNQKSLIFPPPHCQWLRDREDDKEIL